MKFSLPRAAAGLAIFGLALAGRLGGEDVAPPYTSSSIHQAQTMLSDMQEIVSQEYYPNDRIGKEFDARCKEANQALAGVHSNSEAFALIADVLASPDPRIRFYPPLRSSRIDYSWQWTLIGNEAYVTQVDQQGDARKQGLEVGDKVLSYEGVVINRDTYQTISYVFGLLAPRPGLRIQVESPGKEPRWLAIASTVRPQRRLNTSGGPRSFLAAFQLSESDKRHEDEFKDLKAHLHFSGPVAVWRPIELYNDLPAVAAGLKAIKPAQSLILDLRGLNLSLYERMLRLLDGLFVDKFTAGEIKRGKRALTDASLQAGGSAGAFPGIVLVLVDADTSGYAEVLARIIQQKQRGVIIGDFTMGRVLEATWFGQTRGTIASFSTASVRVPTGEVVMSDSAQLDGKGVAPDLLLRPTGADLAARRDVVLAKALAMLKQKVSPEDAYKLVRLPSEDDDDNE